MKKIIFITGVAGMIGSNLLKTYIKKDLIIIGIDNLILGKKKFLSPFIKKKNFFFINNNLNKPLKSKKIIALINKNYLAEVWLLAANSDIQKGTNDPNVDLQNTFLTTFFTLNFLKKFLKKDTKILFSSSSAIYGNIISRINEENTAIKPISNYGAMKLASEGYLSSFSKANNASIFIFRFPNVIGNNLTHGLLFDMKKKILSKNKNIMVLGNGEQQKPYSHVSEIISCMIFIKKKRYINKINYFNIGTDDVGMKVKNIVELLKKALNSKKKTVYQKNITGWVGDVSKYRYSTKKINRLGFYFKLSSKEAVNLAITTIN
jgi:UDP-glucose 4-epimerase